MSYSFTIHAKSKGEAKAGVSAKLAEVCQSQPAHQRDRAAAQAAANAFIDVLVEPMDKEMVNVHMTGALGWREKDQYTSGSVSVNVGITAVA